MSRYIDADKLMEVLNGFTQFHHIETLTVGTFVDMIVDMPTADIQKEIDYWHDRASSYEQTIVKLSNALADRREVVRGKWTEERLPSTSGGSYQVWRCSNCKQAFNWRMNYCGNCGSRMGDGE